MIDPPVQNGMTGVEVDRHQVLDDDMIEIEIAHGEINPRRDRRDEIPMRVGLLVENVIVIGFGNLALRTDQDGSNDRRPAGSKPELRGVTKNREGSPASASV